LLDYWNAIYATTKVCPAEMFMGRELRIIEERDDVMEGNTIRKMGEWMYKFNLKSNTVQRHINQIRSYSKKPHNVRHSSSHGLENVSSVRGYFKAAQNATEDGRTSNSQDPGNEDNHTTSTDDLRNHQFSTVR
jgi:hypothetical protein